ASSLTSRTVPRLSRALIESSSTSAAGSPATSGRISSVSLLRSRRWVLRAGPPEISSGPGQAANRKGTGRGRSTGAAASRVPAAPGANGAEPRARARSSPGMSQGSADGAVPLGVVGDAPERVDDLRPIEIDRGALEAERDVPVDHGERGTRDLAAVQLEQAAEQGRVGPR